MILRVPPYCGPWSGVVVGDDVGDDVGDVVVDVGDDVGDVEVDVGDVVVDVESVVVVSSDSPQPTKISDMVINRASVKNINRFFFIFGTFQNKYFSL